MKKKILCLFVLMSGFISLIPLTVTGQLRIEVSILNEDTAICYNSSPDTLRTKIELADATVYYMWEKRAIGDLNWQVISGENSNKYQPPSLKISTQYHVIIDTNLTLPTIDTSENVTILVYDSLYTGDITGGSQHICFGDDGGTLEAHPDGGDSENYVYKWYKNSALLLGEVDNSLDVGTLTTTSTFYYQVTDNLCDTLNSNTFTIQVLNQLVAGNITGGNSPVCFGGDGGTLNAHPHGGDSLNYKYTWLKNSVPQPGNNSSYYVGTLNETTTFNYIITDQKCDTITSGAYQIAVFQQLNAGDITGGDSQVCYDEDPGTLVADPSGGAGTGTYSIEWFDENDIWQENGPSYHVDKLTQTTGYYYIVNDSENCGPERSTTFICNVYPLLKIGTITGENTSICSGQEGGDLVAHPEGGSGVYTYEWFDNQGPLNKYEQTCHIGELTATNQYYYKITDNEGCIAADNESPKHTITVIDNQTATVNITSDHTESCESELVSYTAHPQPPMAGLKFAWRINNSPDILSYAPDFTTDAIKDGDIVKVEVIYEDPCILNSPVFAEITANVNPLPAEAIIVAKPHSSPVVLIYPADTTGVSYTYQWFKDGVPLSGETSKYYYNSTENGGIMPNAAYSLRIYNEYNCSISLDYTFMVDKSSLFKDADIFILYPNPNKGEFMLSLNDGIIPDDIEFLKLRIVDLNGREIINKELPRCDQLLSLTGFNKGIYLLEVEAGNRFKQIKKLVVY